MRFLSAFFAHPIGWILAFGSLLISTVPVRAEPGTLSITRVDANSIQLTWPSVEGVIYRIEGSEDMKPGSWETLGTGIKGQAESTTYIHAENDHRPAQRHLRVMTEFVSIPEGSFRMGDTFLNDAWPGGGQIIIELPVHEVYVEAFFMGKYEVTKALWDEVGAWGLDHGYPDLAESGPQADSHDPGHPVHNISWFDAVKWCNARSEKEGLTPCYRVDGTIFRVGERGEVECDWAADGYRLPREAEWEKAARGGFEGQRFPWGNTITHGEANYVSVPSFYIYDLSPTVSHHPDYALPREPGEWVIPGTAPVGSFLPNSYGLHDVAGNMREWCWEEWDYYPGYHEQHQEIPSPPSGRVARGGNWSSGAYSVRCSNRYATPPARASIFCGFRLARGAFSSAD